MFVGLIIENSPEYSFPEVESFCDILEDIDTVLPWHFGLVYSTSYSSEGQLKVS
jgi:hypothetical protein